MTGTIHIVVGGQFGSEAKGHLAAELVQHSDSNIGLVVRTGGPNAGHTVVVNEQTHKFRHLPTAAALPKPPTLALATRSVVDLVVLAAEARSVGFPTVFVDPHATVLEPHHADRERNSDYIDRFGSTAKGIGAARIARLDRRAHTMQSWFKKHYGSDWITLQSTPELIKSCLENGESVLIEAAQGYGLGLHSPYYPYATSADCTAIDALADCRVSPWGTHNGIQVWMAVRPYPIRVAGNSGPLWRETNWEALGLPEEYTTVTNKVRRVGHWDPLLVSEAVEANGGSHVRIALMMADQVIPALRGMSRPADIAALSGPEITRLSRWLRLIKEDVGATVHAIGTGTDTMVFLSPLERGWLYHD